MTRASYAGDARQAATMHAGSTVANSATDFPNSCDGRMNTPLGNDRLLPERFTVSRQRSSSACFETTLHVQSFHTAPGSAPGVERVSLEAS